VRRKDWWRWRICCRCSACAPRESTAARLEGHGHHSESQVAGPGARGGSV
jgi:hypothetical protein